MSENTFAIYIGFELEIYSVTDKLKPETRNTSSSSSSDSEHSGTDTKKGASTITIGRFA